jgi:phytoene dehydrogenase-like protein
VRTNEYDVAIVGGGHNGLVAAAYLAKAGLRTIVLESRDIVGGAAVTEQPFGPDYKITSLSYVVSLLPPDIERDLHLAEHGYRVFPQGPYFAPHPDGRALALPDDRRRRHAEITRFSSSDAEAYDRYDEWMGGLASVLAPMLEDVAPRLGSKRPRDLARQAHWLWRLRKLDVRLAADATRLFTMSIADLLDDWFESPELCGVLSVSGVIGTWAGPRSAGTAYVMAHHHVGGTWGFPEGGMGAVSRAIAAAATAAGAAVRTSAPVARVDVRHGRVTGVTLRDGSEITAETVVVTAHPKIAFLELIDRRELPETFVADIQRWNTRSGVVKVNLVVDRLPEFTARPGFDPEVHGGTIVLAPSLDAVETAYQDAVSGLGARRPFADVCIPSVFDGTLAPEGQHVVSMFTQWVPHEWAEAPHTGDLDAHADRVVASMEEVAPGFTSSVLHRQVIGPYEMEHEYGLVGGNIFHGELSPSQLFHLRPAAGFADFRTPIRGLYQGGSATHGGGGVTGVPGRNAARQVLADRRTERLSPRRRARGG